jgi:hypothetical protein
VLLLLVAMALGGEPAIDGTWHLRYDTEAGPVDTTSTFKADGEKLLLVDGGKQEEIGTIRGARIDFVIPDGLPDVGFAADLVVTATVTGDRIRGYYEFLDYAGPVEGVRRR